MFENHRNYQSWKTIFSSYKESFVELVRSDLLMPLTSGRSLNLSRSFYIIQYIPCNFQASTFPGSLSASSYGML